MNDFCNIFDKEDFIYEVFSKSKLTATSFWAILDLKKLSLLAIGYCLLTAVSLKGCYFRPMQIILKSLTSEAAVHLTLNWKNWKSQFFDNCESSQFKRIQFSNSNLVKSEWDQSQVLQFCVLFFQLGLKIKISEHV